MLFSKFQRENFWKIETYLAHSREYRLFPEANFAESTYAIFQITGPDSATATTISLNFDTSPRITLGRGKNAEIQIRSRTISREHCTFRLVDGKIMVQDLYSKYGTLVRADEAFAISEAQYHTLQIGNTILWVKAKKRAAFWKKFVCCKVSETEQNGENDEDGCENNNGGAEGNIARTLV